MKFLYCTYFILHSLYFLCNFALINILNMFSSGQLIFAVFFVVAFAIAMVYTYRRDLKIHNVHYKNIYVVVLSIIAVIALFTVITFSMH